MGTVWGVAFTAAIVQTTLKTKLPDALGDIPNKDKVSALVIVDSNANGADEILVH